jgi:hypothetical protein
MHHRRMCVALIAIFTMAPFAWADADGTPPGASPTLASVMTRLAADPLTPDEYTASISLHVRLRIFPFIRFTLHGDSAYKRPGFYHFVFRGVPKAAEKFNDLRYDLGDPQKWPDRYEIAFAPQSTAAVPVIRLTPKVPAMVKTLDVEIDPVKGHLVRATWSRNDGGTIVLVQHFTAVGEHEIVAEQEATIAIPHMRAELVADYSNFVIPVPGSAAGNGSSVAYR